MIIHFFRMNKCVGCLLLAFLLIPFASCKRVDDYYIEEPSLIDTIQVYGDGSSYCAFTSMVVHDGVWYLAFREGSSHIDISSVITVLRSFNGIIWSFFQTISSDNMDLRDPNLSIMPNGDLFLICGGRKRRQDGIFSTKSYYARFDDGKFGEVMPLNMPRTIDDNPLCWLWRLTWNGNIGYGAVYRNDGLKDRLTLVKTKDGINYEIITELEVGRIINETRLRFLPDQTMVALMRSDGNGFMGVSKPPYTQWEMTQLDIYLAGQDFVFDRDIMICASRRIDYDGEKTVVYFGNLNGEFDSVIELPSYGIAGDTSYPSIIDQGDYYYVSYYSKHETVKPCIYLSKIAKGTRKQ